MALTFPCERLSWTVDAEGVCITSDLRCVACHIESSGRSRIATNTYTLNDDPHPHVDVAFDGSRIRHLSRCRRNRLRRPSIADADRIDEETHTVRLVDLIANAAALFDHQPALEA